MRHTRSEDQSHPRKPRIHRRSAVSGLLVSSDDIKGRVLDISDTGLSISTSSRVKLGQNVSFHIIGEHRSLVSGEVRWVQEDSIKTGRSGEPTTIYRVGLSLLHEPRRLPSP